RQNFYRRRPHTLSPKFFALFVSNLFTKLTNSHHPSDAPPRTAREKATTLTRQHTVTITNAAIIMPGAEDYREIIQDLKQQVEDLQNENMTILSEVDHLKDMQKELADETGYYQKKYTAMETELTAARHLAGRLETQLYSQEQETANLRKENQHLNKFKKDLEKKLAGEAQQFENDRVQWQKREADLYNQIRTLSTNGLNPSSPRRRSVSYIPSGSNGASGLSILGGISEADGNSFSSSGSLASTLTVGNDSNSNVPQINQVDSSYTREAKIASRTIKAQDKLISDLKADVEKHKATTQENLQQVQRQAMKIEHLENEIANVKQVNRSLMEDNESYQILLHEKTMSGEFMLNPIMQNNRFGSDDYDTINEPRRKESSSSKNGLNLAAELNLASVSSGTWESVQKESETNLMVEKLSEENKGLKDENKALALYVNKILLKIMANKQLEEVLSIDVPDDEAPPPPPAPKLARPSPATPVPESTKSSSFLSRPAVSRPRRKTISTTPMSLWGTRPATSEDDKVTNPAATTGSSSTPTTSTSTALKPARGHTRSPSEVISADAKAARRHSSIAPGSSLSSPILSNGTSSLASSDRSSSGSTGGWAKALKRMSGIGWSRNNSDDNLTDATDLANAEDGDVEIKVNGPASGTTSPLRKSGDVDVLESLEEGEER
ncbi:hypothetical protein BC937DRAFT_88928, partial [Endogone sp. FLAS-F59071]